MVALVMLCAASLVTVVGNRKIGVEGRLQTTHSMDDKRVLACTVSRGGVITRGKNDRASYAFNLTCTLLDEDSPRARPQNTVGRTT